MTTLTNLLELKEKVLKNDLEWKIVDKDKANESLKENQENFKKYGFYMANNKTGIKYVHKSKNHSKQGFSWCYKKIINKKRYDFSLIDLRILKEKVLLKDLKWEILDEYLANKSFKENEENIKKFHKN